uniref:LuxR C-terminal-related transcriptional regulator n=1 Tax=Phenylobacterium sp. TaxID=1871053 RepID=UPI002869EDB1
MSDTTAKASMSLVIEAMYAVAADPQRWEQMVEALDLDVGVGDPALSQEGARLVRAAAARPDGGHVGVILVSRGGGVIAGNPAGEAVFLHRLGVIEARGLRFLNPSNHEALDQARRRLRETGARQVIVKFLQGADDGPHFAYVTPARALPPGLAATLPAAAMAGEDLTAIVFPAVETTDRLWSSVRDSFGLTPAETRLAARLKNGMTLKEAADDLSITVNTVRNQLRAVFDKMGLNRQSELVRALTQLSSLANAFEAPSGDQPWSPAIFATGKGAADTAPPVQIFRLADGRALAWRDYGDPLGKPVLVMVADVASSLLPRGTDALARDLGLRLVTPERAGCGRSDPHPDFGIQTVAADSVALCRHLKLEGLQVGSMMDGTVYALEAARQLGDTVSRILAVSGRTPGPQVERARDAGHTMTLFWRRISRNPWLSDMVFEMMRVSLNRRQIERYAAGAASAPADAAHLKAHPELLDFIADYMRETVAVTSKGAADAVRCAAASRQVDLTGLAAPVTLWYGEDDPMQDVGEVVAWLGD